MFPRPERDLGDGQVLDCETSRVKDRDRPIINPPFFTKYYLADHPADRHVHLPRMSGLRRVVDIDRGVIQLGRIEFS